MPQLYEADDRHEPPAGAEVLDRLSAPGALLAPATDDAVRCLACGHRCLIRVGRRGICKVRYNRDGVLRVPHGYVAALQCDPIEKKPFFHVRPGGTAMTFGMLGCDLQCDYCQNWMTSQALRDPAAFVTPHAVSADEIVAAARQAGAAMIASSYNEPLITAEWAAEVFAAAKRSGLLTGFVSNGNATPEVLDYLRPVTDCYKIDLKSMSDRSYRRLGGVLGNILDGVRMVHARGFWLEIVTLLVPGFNDGADEVRQVAEFIASVSPDIPWHVTAFHPDYRMTDRAATVAGQILRACETGRAAGLRFVYGGNAPGRLGDWEDTRCTDCGDVVVERRGYMVGRVRLNEQGGCGTCGARVPGLWR